MLTKVPGFYVSDKAKIAWKDENKLSSLGELIKSSSRPQYELGCESAKHKSKSIIDYGAIPAYYEIILISLPLCFEKMSPFYSIIWLSSFW